MKYYLIAGEASGDLHGSNLMKELRKVDSEYDFRCWGGDLMQNQDGELVKHYRDLAFMGLVDVLMNIRTILKNFKLCKKDLLAYKPDVLILIDYPGFNLKMAKFAKEHGIKVFYYISPKIWAWKKSRIKQIKKYVDEMYIIFPFEIDFYKQFDYPVEFVGNPLLDAIEQRKVEVNHKEFIEKYNLENKPIISLLPGSRKQEINKLLSIYLTLPKYYPDYQFVIAATSALEKSYYQQFMNESKVPLVFDSTYEILQHSEAAIVTSGTATLETALLEIPEVVCYRAGELTYQVGKRVVNIDFFSLVNLVMGREVVKELLQHQVNTQTVKQELDKLLFDKENRNKVLKDYKILQEKLGGSGASERLAKSIYKKLTF